MPYALFVLFLAGILVYNVAILVGVRNSRAWVNRLRLGTADKTPMTPAKRSWIILVASFMVIASGLAIFGVVVAWSRGS